jgi:hypothetical protein
MILCTFNFAAMEAVLCQGLYFRVQGLSCWKEGKKRNCHNRKRFADQAGQDRLDCCKTVASPPTLEAKGGSISVTIRV